jgi:hypothetical protein
MIDDFYEIFYGDNQLAFVCVIFTKLNIHDTGLQLIVVLTSTFVSFGSFLYAKSKIFEICLS